MPEQRMFEKLVARLGAELSRGIPEATRGRCLSRQKLQRLLVEIRNDLGLSSRDVGSGERLLRRLTESGLASRVPVESPAVGRDVTSELYVVGLGASVESLHPVELLTGIEPDGVVSYFSALSLHSLTTQIPPYHHIVKLTRRIAAKAILDSAREGAASPSPSRRRDPLGTKQFAFQGATYYYSRRAVDLVPGTKRRYLNEYTIFRMTTVEQTLLDTLMSPVKCGGPAVIFEAWDRGSENLNEKSLLALLDKIDDAALDIRTSYMLEIRNFSLRDAAMRGRLEHSRHVLRTKDRLPVPLLKGYHFSGRDDSGLLEVP